MHLSTQAEVEEGKNKTRWPNRAWACSIWSKCLSLPLLHKRKWNLEAGEQTLMITAWRWLLLNCLWRDEVGISLLSWKCENGRTLIHQLILSRLASSSNWAQFTLFSSTHTEVSRLPPILGGFWGKSLMQLQRLALSYYYCSCKRKRK